MSIASLWEMAIKSARGKLTLHAPFEALIPREIRRCRLTLLPITPEHTMVIANLPHHHRDPFDRMLVAQASVEDLPIPSADPALDAYAVPRLWA